MWNLQGRNYLENLESFSYKIPKKEVKKQKKILKTGS